MYSTEIKLGYVIAIFKRSFFKVTQDIKKFTEVFKNLHAILFFYIILILHLHTIIHV